MSRGRIKPPIEANKNRMRRYLIRARRLLVTAMLVIASGLGWVGLVQESAKESGFDMVLVIALTILAAFLFLLLCTRYKETHRSVSGSSLPPFWEFIATLVMAINCLISGFATAYWKTAAARPNSFNEPLSKFDAVYFSIGTFTTAGTGSLAAISTRTRELASAEMVCAVVLISVGLSIAIGRLRR